MDSLTNLKFEVIKKISEVRFKYKDLSKISKIESNSPPSVFVGSKLKYPLMNVGVLSPVEKDPNSWIYDNPKYWAGNQFQVEDVLKLRNSLLNSRFRSSAKDARLNKRFLEMAREIALSSRQVDFEVSFKNRLNLNRSKDRILTPHGFSAEIKGMRVTENVKIPIFVDKIINDDIKSKEGI